jgi:hypothetical protein
MTGLAARLEKRGIFRDGQPGRMMRQQPESMRQSFIGGM